MKPLNVEAKKKILGFFRDRKILAIHLINYIDLNGLLHHVNNINCPESD
jgi:hypothetical protein